MHVMHVEKVRGGKEGRGGGASNTGCRLLVLVNDILYDEIMELNQTLT